MRENRNVARPLYPFQDAFGKRGGGNSRIVTYRDAQSAFSRPLAKPLRKRFRDRFRGFGREVDLFARDPFRRDAANVRSVFQLQIFP